MSHVILLEPYYGGSHKAFLKVLSGNLPFEFILLTLPPRKWKWRMRFSAMYFADELRRLPSSTISDCKSILCSPYVDVAAFKALAPAWVSRIPVATYFHENQFAYPVRKDDIRDFHFAVTNLTTAMASDRLAFNSEYNRSTFLDGVRGIVKKIPDMTIEDPADRIYEKSIILPPLMDFNEFDRTSVNPLPEGPPVILWNHRWEHDKDPETFFRTLFELDGQGVDFRLIVAGKSFRSRPDIFAAARESLAHRIVHFGYARSRKEYIRLLMRSDLVVSTANHEFFGIAVIEAVRAGCRPLLPARLSYPELFPEEFLYKTDIDLPEALIASLSKGRLSKEKAHELTDRFAWMSLADQYGEWLYNR